LQTLKQMLLTLFNHNQTVRFQQSYPTTAVALKVPFHEGPGDNYAVTAWVDGYQGAGFPTVQVAPDVDQQS